LFLLGLLLPATIVAIRAVPSLVSLPWGQSLPPGAAFLLFLMLLAPFGLTSGYFFPCACRIQEALFLQGAVGRVYYLETLGAALGVCLLQLLLLGHFPNLGLGLLAGLLLVLCAWALTRPVSFMNRLAAAGALLLMFSALLFLPSLESLSRRWQWPGRQVVATRDSPYALLTATREAEQYSFFANNLWYFTYPDPLNAEHQVQLGLLQHPHPRRVLLLGGGAAGLIPEILKTSSITHLQYVELDPQLVELAVQLLPDASIQGELTGKITGKVGKSPRAEIIYEDARRFLVKTPWRYDVILMALPEPQNAQLNRFYTWQFFQLAALRLAPGGVFSFALTGGETSLHPLRAAYLALAYNTLRLVFPEVLAFPGERVRFFATSTPGTLVGEAELLMDRLKARHLDLQYIQEYYLLHDLSRPRLAYLNLILKQPPQEFNSDLNPKCYFYDLVFSGIQEGLPLKELLLTLKGVPPFFLKIGMVLITILILALLRARPGPLYLYQVLVMGIGTMTLEIVVLVLYQIHLGYLYRQLGILIAAFMAGMALGGAVGARLALWPQTGVRLLTGLQGGLAVLALALAWALPLAPGLPFRLWEGFTQAGYALFLVGVGFGGGGIFALSASLWNQARPGPGTKGGYLYAADLLGATLGTLGASLVVLPVWGILPALYLVAALHGGAGLMLLLKAR
jgi:spermidine synthase